MGRTRPRHHRGERGQATVELALVLPAVTLLLVLVLQVGLLARDRVAAVAAARVAARAVIVEPSEGAARRALWDHGGPGAGAGVTVGGQLRPGGLARVTVEMEPTRLPLTGRFLGGLVLREQLTVLVEG